MKNILLTAIEILFFAVLIFGQTASKSISAEEIIGQIEAGKPINYENVIVTGDFDLSKISKRINDATYPEQGKTARVYSAKINQPVVFKNVTFQGKLTFFRRETSKKEISEYRLVFSDAVKFENCSFNETADFELANFDANVSFENSTFKMKPSFIRVGLVRTPIFDGTKFEQGSIVKNFQNDTPQNFSAEELKNFYDRYLESSK